MNYQALIQKTIDYIEEHLCDQLNVETLAKYTGFSTYHFYKVFNSYLGMPVMEYVNRRRLQHALYDLSNNEKIIDIAFKYGFDTHAGFNKAFKKCFGYSPAFYRIHAPNNLPLPVILKDLKQLGGLMMQPKIEKREAFKLVGYQFKTTLRNNSHARDIPAFWDECNIEGKEKHLYDTQNPVKHGEYGLCVQLNYETDEFIYFFGIETSDFNTVSDEMTTLTVPEATYAVFTTPKVTDEHFVETIKKTWKYILEEWFPKSGYEIDETKYDFEFYDERCHPWDHSTFCMEIHIPIKSVK